MGTLFVILRTYPFWAIPLSLALLTGFLPGRRKGRSGPSKWWLLLGLILLSTSILFLAKRGHVTAVPFLHEMLTGQSKPLPVE